MNTVRVFRVVDENSHGMYTGSISVFDGEDYVNGSLWVVSCGSNSYSDEHPSPDSDGIPRYYLEPDTLFAFQSISLLQKWIYKSIWIENMTKNGGRIVCFKVDSDQVIYGSKQCVFNSEFATIEYSLPIKDAIALEESKGNLL